MNYISFDRTKPASHALEGDPNTIYFTTDTHEIIINGEAFGTDDLSELQEQIEAHAEEINTLTTGLSKLQRTHAEEAEVIAVAFNDLAKRLDQSTTSLQSVIVENELTTSAALNDLNGRLSNIISTLTIDAMFV